MPSFVPIFIHGAGSNRDFWREQQAAFPAGHYLNLPGHTAARDTSRGEGKQSISEYADWVDRYASIAGLRDAVLIGHSMGGAIALSLALRRLPWIHALVLVGTGARLPIPGELLQMLRENYHAAVDYIVERSFAPDTGELMTYAKRARRNGVRRQLLRTSPQVTLGDYLACAQFDVTSRLNDIRLPALCMVGSEDRMVAPLYSEHLHAGIKGSRLEIVEGAGHMLPLENPEEFNRFVSEFLEAVAGEVG